VFDDPALDRAALAFTFAVAGMTFGFLIGRISKARGE